MSFDPLMDLFFTVSILKHLALFSFVRLKTRGTEMNVFRSIHSNASRWFPRRPPNFL